MATDKLPDLAPVVNFAAGLHPSLTAYGLHPNVVGGLIATLLPIQVAVLKQNSWGRGLPVTYPLLGLSCCTLLLSGSRIDYNGGMDITERLVSSVAQRVTGGMKIQYDGKEIDLTPPWRRWTLRDSIRELSGIDYVNYPTAESLEAVMREKGIAVKPGQSVEKSDILLEFE